MTEFKSGAVCFYYGNDVIVAATVSGAADNLIFDNGANIMSKSQDTKKAVKKEPLKTLKEKKADKKVKKEERKRQ
jgi:hypothetical protein